MTQCTSVCVFLYVYIYGVVIYATCLDRLIFLKEDEFCLVETKLFSFHKTIENDELLEEKKIGKSKQLQFLTVVRLLFSIIMWLKTDSLSVEFPFTQQAH